MANERQVQMLGLFERVHEPSYVPKSRVIFNVPSSHVEASVRPHIRTMIGTPQPGDTVVNVQEVPPVDVSSINNTVRRGAFFSHFLRSHREAAYRLVRIFRGYSSFSEFLSAASYCRDRVNSDLFVYALSLTILRRNDSRSLRLPPLYQVLPDLYVDSACVKNAREMSRRPQEAVEPILLDRNFSGTDHDPEHKVWYFREDFGINSHHWHWHIVYPVSFGDLSNRKDRSGELFYYMHSQVLARYDAERLANGLRRVAPLHNFREVVTQGYFPKLTRENSGMIWGSRPEGLRLQDVTREEILGEPAAVKVNDLERWRDRIMGAIHQGFIVNPDGSKTSLTDVSGTPVGIDLLGRMVESSYSPNPDFYGDVHNFAHFIISVMHDPDGKHREPPGVMAFTATAMRDPIFYMGHKWVDNMFVEHKRTLPAYTVDEFSFPGVEVGSIKVVTPGNQDNVLITGWQQTDVDLSRGLDLIQRREVAVRITHLQHANFQYQIRALNSNNAVASATVRIFIAPKFNENNDLYPLNTQRELMIEMDKFQAELQPGENLITRSSLESEVTIPPEQTFAELENAPDTGSAEAYCGCGWPQHMLVPRGTHQGMLFSLVVMLTDWEVDRVVQPPTQIRAQCSNAASYCGLQDGRYPDSKPMGFPWDRRLNTDRIPNLNSFPGNMGNVDITIRFTDEVIRTADLTAA